MRPLRSVFRKRSPWAARSRRPNRPPSPALTHSRSVPCLSGVYRLCSTSSSGSGTAGTREHGARDVLPPCSWGSSTMNCRLPGVSGYAFTTGSPLAVNVDDNKDRSPCYHLPRSAIAGVGPGCPHRTALSSQGGLRSHLVPHVTGAYRRAGLAFVLRLRLVSPLSEPARRVAYSAIASRVMQCLSVSGQTRLSCAFPLLLGSW
jgi:hypothetical protein